MSRVPALNYISANTATEIQDFHIIFEFWMDDTLDPVVDLDLPKVVKSRFAGDLKTSVWDFTPFGEEKTGVYRVINHAPINKMVFVISSEFGVEEGSGIENALGRNDDWSPWGKIVRAKAFPLPARPAACRGIEPMGRPIIENIVGIDLN
jgi:hypothetical protein